MSLLDRKLMRDVRSLRGPIMTIALVIATGIAVFIASMSTYASLLAARESFYVETRFPQVFVSVKRAPRALLPQIEAIPGVIGMTARIVRDAVVDRPAARSPVSARIVSIENAGDEPLARLVPRRGTAPSPGDAHQIAVNEAFAEANRIEPGDTLRLILNGRIEPFTISGIMLSPEFVYAVKAGGPIPDDGNYAVVWMDRRAMEASFDMKGAYDDLVIMLAPGSDAVAVIAELDRLLEPYGSLGAIERRDQPSNRFLDDELNQQRVTSITIPLIFFGVAAFLLNVTMGRLVTAQREQIAALRALGFDGLPIALHYLKLLAVVVLLGAAIGVPAGIALGEAMMGSYRGFFRFPSLDFTLTRWSVLVAVGVSFAFAALGVLSALRAILALTPAAAMRPAMPQRFRHAVGEQWLPAGFLKPSGRMVVRTMAGRPVRTLLTITGVAFAVPMVVLGLFWRDAVDRMTLVQYELIERANVSITFSHPLPGSAIGDLARLPGVLAAEGQRVVPVRLRVGNRSRLSSVLVLPVRSDLRRPHDAGLRPISVPTEGITLSRRLAERLGVRLGDAIAVEVLEGHRRIIDVPVAALVDDMIGMGSYMSAAMLEPLTGERDGMTSASLFVDPAALPDILARLKAVPVLASVVVRSQSLDAFMDKVGTLVLVSAGILTLFGAIIAVGVVYNAARTRLQEQAWELASLRVLGFRREEVSRIHFAEFAIEIALGVPIGLLVSTGIIRLLASLHANESFEIPAVISPGTYLLAALVILTAALASAWLVRRQIDRLDLVSVLKTRE